MQQNGSRLRELLDDEGDGAHDLSPAGEAAIRAHLCLVSEALAATAGPATREGLKDLAVALPERFDDDEAGLDGELELLKDAAAHELNLQFGTERAGSDRCSARRSSEGSGCRHGHGSSCGWSERPPTMTVSSTQR